MASPPVSPLVSPKRGEAGYAVRLTEAKSAEVCAGQAQALAAP